MIFPLKVLRTLKKLTLYKENIYDLNISDFFKEHSESMLCLQ